MLSPNEAQQSFSGRLTLCGKRPTLKQDTDTPQPSPPPNQKSEYQCQAGKTPALHMSQPYGFVIDGPTKQNKQKLCMLDQLTVFPVAKEQVIPEDRPSNIIYRVFSLPKTMDNSGEYQRTPRSKLASQQRPRQPTRLLSSSIIGSDNKSMTYTNTPKKRTVEVGRQLFSRDKTYCRKCGRLAMSSYINCDYCQRQANMASRPFRPKQSSFIK